MRVLFLRSKKRLHKTVYRAAEVSSGRGSLCEHVARVGFLARTRGVCVTTIRGALHAIYVFAKIFDFRVQKLRKSKISLIFDLAAQQAAPLSSGGLGGRVREGGLAPPFASTACPV